MVASPGIKKSQRRKPRSTHYHAAKITDRQFETVLWHFVRDHSATEAAAGSGLSVNSAHAIYRKLRVFFYECGLFLDFYEGRDPETFESANPRFEQELLAFHFKRHSDKRGFRSPVSEPPYHFAESCWRFDFHIMARERSPEALHPMMTSHLLELIHLAGPVGLAPRNRAAAVRAVMRQADQRIDWLRRSAPGFRIYRDELANIAGIR